MKNDKRTEYAARDSILELPSDDEVGRVSTAETVARLSDGDEYLDLEHLDQGVRCARGTATPMGRVLPRKAAHANTWSKILTQLAERKRCALRVHLGADVQAGLATLQAAIRQALA